MPSCYAKILLGGNENRITMWREVYILHREVELLINKEHDERKDFQKYEHFVKLIYHRH